MAGAGRRTFTPGEVLTASNVMNYLQDQAVMNFAGTAARGSAIGTAVAEGMVSYLADTNAIEAYTGSSWEQVFPALKWAGSIVQVVSAQYSTATTSTSSTMANTGLTATITPTKSTNKIIAIATHTATGKTPANAENRAKIQLMRDATIIANTGALFLYTANAIYNVAGTTLISLDSPGSTSALTYKTQFNSVNNTASVIVQYDSSVSTMLLIEVSA